MPGARNPFPTTPTPSRKADSIGPSKPSPDPAVKFCNPDYEYLPWEEIVIVPCPPIPICEDFNPYYPELYHRCLKTI
jgi:hypothetical protein